MRRSADDFDSVADRPSETFVLKSAVEYAHVSLPCGGLLGVWFVCVTSLVVVRVCVCVCARAHARAGLFHACGNDETVFSANYPPRSCQWLSDEVLPDRGRSFCRAATSRGLYRFPCVACAHVYSVWLVVG